MTFIALFYIVAVFLLGAILGSFLNVVAVDTMNIYMKEKLYERSESKFIFSRIFSKEFWRHAVTHRSACDTCDTVLTPKELVPVVSYLWQKGRCRTCDVSFSPQHLYVELIAGVIFLGVFLTVFSAYSVLSPLFFFEVFYLFVFFALGIILMIFDYEHMIVPNFTVYPMMIMAFVAQILPFRSLPDISITESISAAVILAAPLFLIWLVTKGTAMGFADWKIGFVIGALLGINLGISGWVFSFWIGALISMALIMFSKSRKSVTESDEEGRDVVIREDEDETLNLKSAVPFGPFLILGLWTAYVTGVVIIGIL